MTKRASWWAVAVLPLVVSVAACGSATGVVGPSPATPGQGSAGSGAQAADRAAALVGVWHLASLEKMGASPVVPPSDVILNVDFRADGRTSLVVDCNRCSGGYRAGDGILEVGAMACTRAWCASAPLDTDFEGLVSGAQRWSVDRERLTLASPQGTLRLTR